MPLAGYVRISQQACMARSVLTKPLPHLLPPWCVLPAPPHRPAHTRVVSTGLTAGGGAALTEQGYMYTGIISGDRPSELFSFCEENKCD